MTADQEAELLELWADFHKASSESRQRDVVAKAAKKAMEAAQDAVNDFLADLSNPTARLPFGESADPLAGDAPATAHAVPVVPSEGGEDYQVLEDDERWRHVRFDSMTDCGMKPGDVQKLAQAYPPLHTMGDLVDWMNANEHRRLTDLDGIGDASADRISDAMIRWHEANPRPKAPGIASNASEGKDGESIKPDAEGPSDAESGDVAGIPGPPPEPTAADRQPIRQRKPRKAKAEPEVAGPLPADPEQAERDWIDQRHTEAERPDAFEQPDEDFDRSDDDDPDGREHDETGG